ncbi:expressed unknown protein [Seminavis robusta]|uniref:Uncharacterized protein n=1 Tax=Seminavis robusta TaxID=568900 RepID=A0A9N8EZA1_9STRA|nr:expressed unknown protein [Seminavis robusta]|eukprot:Sro2550_g330930.1 n/a (515) ;mRNA; f:2699-4243
MRLVQAWKRRSRCWSWKKENLEQHGSNASLQQEEEHELEQNGSKNEPETDDCGVDIEADEESKKEEDDGGWKEHEPSTEDSSLHPDESEQSVFDDEPTLLPSDEFTTIKPSEDEGFKATSFEEVEKMGKDVSKWKGAIVKHGRKVTVVKTQDGAFPLNFKDFKYNYGRKGQVVPSSWSKVEALKVPSKQGEHYFERDFAPEASWNIDIDAEDTISMVFLCSASREAFAVCCLANALVWFFGAIFIVWLSRNTEPAMYEGEAYELVAILVVILGVVCLGMLSDLKNEMDRLPKLSHIAGLMRCSERIALKGSVTLHWVNLAQTVAFKGLSFYVGLCENNLLDVILNVVAVDYLAAMDTAMKQLYCLYRLGDKKINLTFVDIHYIDPGESVLRDETESARTGSGYWHIGQARFWEQNKTNPRAVQNKLNDESTSNEKKLDLLLQGTWDRFEYPLELPRGLPMVSSMLSHTILFGWEQEIGFPENSQEQLMILLGCTRDDWEFTLEPELQAALMLKF